MGALGVIGILAAITALGIIGGIARGIDWSHLPSKLDGRFWKARWIAMTTDDFYSYNTQYKNLPAGWYSENDRYAL